MLSNMFCIFVKFILRINFVFSGTVVKQLNSVQQNHPTAKFQVRYDGDEALHVVSNLHKDYMEGDLVIMP